MTYRAWSRAQDWLLPPTLGELISADHPVRFVAEFVDGLDLAQLGIRPGSVLGASSFHPGVLLAAWVYGFMVGLRSSRKLERACHEQIPFMWLTGVQRPDHVTLWRFYAAHRPEIRQLLKQTVAVAVEAGLVDFAFQAIDGSRVAISGQGALRERAVLERLQDQVDAEIAAMEQALQAEAGPDGQLPKPPRGAWAKYEMRERVQRALEVLAEQEARKQTKTEAGPAAGQPTQRAKHAKAGKKTQTPAPSEAEQPTETPAPTAAGQPTRTSAPGEAEQPTETPAPTAAGQPSATPAPSEAPATPAVESEKPAQARGYPPRASLADPEAVLLKGRHGYVVGYNGQAVVDGKAQIVVAADVFPAAADANLLVPMLDELCAMTGRQPQAAGADTGYFAMDAISEAARRGIDLYVPDGRLRRKDGPDKNPYHKDHFVYDPASDTYTCPEGRTLHLDKQSMDRDKPIRRYQPSTCAGCPAQANGACTHGKARNLIIYGHEAQLQAHSAKMQGEAAHQIMRQRLATVEPVFAVFREQIGLLRWLSRGLVKVRAEWRLVCVAHNLRKLWKFWWRPKVLAGLPVS
jgi:transposase